MSVSPPMHLRRLLFLDIDGVCNHARCFKNPPVSNDPGGRVLEGLRRHERIDPECIRHLNRIVYVTHTAIVISSTWRLSMPLDQIQTLLGAAGFEHRDRIIGATPHMTDEPRRGFGERGQEIARWIDATCDFTLGGSRDGRMVILDDEADMRPFDAHLVRTSFETGLTKADAEKAIELLRR